MKRHSLSISIPEPCHEDWSEMTQREKGRHCASCNKTVIDFTRMSKAGIINHISNDEMGMCGRFNPDQLNLNLLPARRNRLFSKWAAVFLGLIPFAGYSQTPIHADELTEQSIMGKRMINVNNNQLTKPITREGVLTGKLIDADTKEPILFGSVIIKSDLKTIRGVDTDLDGNFRIDIKDGSYIEFSYIGYKSETRRLDNIITSKSNLEVELGSSSLGLGVVVINEQRLTNEIAVTGGISYTIVPKRDSWLIRQWKKLKSLVITSHDAAAENRELSKANKIDEDLEFQETAIREVTSVTIGVEAQVEKVINIYPNPSAGLVKIEIPEGISQSIIQITNVNNQIVHTRKISTNEFQYDASHLLSGSYIISIISDNKLIASKVFIKI